MKRSILLKSAAGLTALAAGWPANGLASAPKRSPISPLRAPTSGVPAAFLLSDGAVVIDFAGPWEVFQDAYVAGRTEQAFLPYTVSETRQPIAASNGMRIVPHYDFTNAPLPKLVVVPAQSAPSSATKQWLNMVAHDADVVMSVCTGAFVLAKAGLLDGRRATTHHASLTRLAMEYPSITVRRGSRFVDDGRVATSAGLSAGIDLALHMVARYFGEDAARRTAYYMEYQSQAWLYDNSNTAYRKPPAPHAGFVLCAICWMEVDPKTARASVYHSQHYYFCMQDHKRLFDSAPQRFLDVS